MSKFFHLYPKKERTNTKTKITPFKAYHVLETNILFFGQRRFEMRNTKMKLNVFPKIVNSQLFLDDFNPTLVLFYFHN